jgi:putative ABC transport system ATP-binding protein
MNPQPLVACERVAKVYRMGEQDVIAVRDVSLAIMPGEYVAVMGPSGSGKSTFMNLIGALDVPTTGDVRIAGKSLAKLDGDELARLRNKTIGFVFQQFNLLARTKALANVMLPTAYGAMPRAQAETWARRVLERVGLGDRMDHLPSQLSGGQQQRVAIARALVNDPQLLLADEPTGALDSVTSEEVMKLLGELNASGITVVLITHDPDVAAYARRQIRFKDGRVVSDEMLERAA